MSAAAVAPTNTPSSRPSPGREDTRSCTMSNSAKRASPTAPTTATTCSTPCAGGRRTTLRRAGSAALAAAAGPCGRYRKRGADAASSSTASGTTRYASGSSSMAALAAYRQCSSHDAAAPMWPRRASRCAANSPSAEVVSTRYPGYMLPAGPSLCDPTNSASSHTHTREACSTSSAPVAIGGACAYTRPGTMSAGSSAARASLHSRRRCRPPTAMSRNQ
mmetsp:Transcript_29043/g.74108  ORF Transcript_29043/g.74108 Transcript_29043/m.74108 type:complete len:219 (+) Transcript_29043:1906-2562(+)